jgi:protein kinase C substrate 80K-H
VCDCCDGSDEWISTTCANECLALGESDRLQAIARAKMLEEGLAKKRELIAAGREFRRTKAAAIGQIEAELADVEKHYVTAEDAKVTAEGKEKEALDAFKALHVPPPPEPEQDAAAEETKRAGEKFEELDLNQDGTLHLDEMLKNSAFDYDGNGAVTEDEILLLTSGNSEFTKETFASLGWPSLKDRLKKHAAPAEGAREEHEAGDDEEDMEDMEDYHPEHDENAESTTQANKPSADMEYDEATQTAVDAASAARDKFYELERKKRELEDQRDTIRKQLDNDYGPEDEYASLEGHCFELDTSEYIYKVCPFDTCSQRPKRGGSETQLGKWDKWADEDHSAMNFANGTERSRSLRSTSSATSLLYFNRLGVLERACADGQSQRRVWNREQGDVGLRAGEVRVRADIRNASRLPPGKGGTSPRRAVGPMSPIHNQRYVPAHFHSTKHLCLMNIFGTWEVCALF